MGDAIVIGVLVAVIHSVIRYIVKSRKSKKGCGGNCGGCSGCHQSEE